VDDFEIHLTAEQAEEHPRFPLKYTTNSLFPPRKFAMMLPNVFGDWTKVLIEKMLMLKYRKGWSFLP
jgi:hypothetical protein